MNLVVIVLDTLRYDVVHHTNAGRQVDTPALDALRADSVSFSRCFAEGLPSLQVRQALFTGMRTFPWRRTFDTRGLWPGSRGWHKIPPEYPTLAEVLLARGYKTALIGDVFHMFKPTLNFTRGWTTWEFVRGQEDDNWAGGRLDSVREEAARYVKGNIDLAKHAMLAQYLLNKRRFSKTDPLTSGTVFRRAIDWVAENHDDGPFLLWIESFDPHEPWDPPRELADRYCPDFTGTEFLFPSPAARFGTALEQERTKALYYGEITYVDAWIGRLLERLDDAGRLDDTVVMVTSDHGTELLDHGVFGKRPFYLHPPITQLNWIVRHPRLPRRAVTVPEFVQDHDLFPTALELLEVQPPESPELDPALAGRSVVPLIRAATGDLATHDQAVQAARAGRQQVITGYGDFAGVRTDRWNYITNFEAPAGVAPPNDWERPAANTRLYDLVADPREQRDVAVDHPQIVAELRRVLEHLLGQELPARLPDRERPRTATVRPSQVFFDARSSFRSESPEP